MTIFLRDEVRMLASTFSIGVFRSSTDAAMFEDFVDELLCHCGKWPELRSVLVTDSASFRHSEQISQMCADTGVKLV